jgi:hypothetical protein
MRPRFRILVATLLICHATARGISDEVSAIPDLRLRVAVRQKENGKIDKGIHILTLDCVSGDCWLTSVSLNQCSDGPLGKAAFPVVVDISSTKDGRLKVTNLGDTLKVEERATDIAGESTNTFLFGYRMIGDWANLTSFSGGFVKHSSLLNRVITVEYVPYRRLMQAVPLDCPLLAPGVNLSDLDDLISSLPEDDQVAWKNAQRDPNRPHLTDDARAQRLFPNYEQLKREGKYLSDDQWEKLVTVYLDDVEVWLTRNGVSPASRKKIRELQSAGLLEQLKKKK